MNNESTEEELFFTLPDGRRLGYLIVGEGKPVFYFHGHPSSRLDVLYTKEYANSRNLKIIGVDRPGFGLSTYTPRSSLRDFADDVNHLAEHLGIDKFTLIGISGGGPSAITYTALFPDRVTQAVVIGSPSLPLNLNETFHGLQKIIVKLASKFETIGIWYLKQEKEVFYKLAKDAEPRENKKLLEMLSKDDARLFEDEASRNGFYRTFLEFYRQGDDSIRSLYEERMLWMKGWDVDLSQIPPGRVYILHGSDDKMVPVENAYRNAEAVPGAQLEIVEGKGHFFWLDNYEMLDKILR